MIAPNPFPALQSLGAVFNRAVDERRPSKLLMLLEGRASLEWASLAWALPVLQRHVPRGDGHPVLVLPGLMATDVSTAPLRQFLQGRGYAVQGWGQGRNRGPREGVVEAMHATLADMHKTSGRTVSVIGWSLGGMYAREIARAAPRLVRQVITLGSPLYGSPHDSSNVSGIYRRVSGRTEKDDAHFRDHSAPPVPTTSIYTRTDGIVGWGCSVEKKGPLTDNIEINSASHTGLGFNPLVWYAIGDRLAQKEDAWEHFTPQGVTRMLYPFTAPER